MQRAQIVLPDLRDLSFVQAAELVEKVIDQQLQVLRTFPQRGQIERNHRQAVEQLLAEQALIHHLFHVPAGGRDEAHLNFDRFVAADRFHLLFLNGPQQLRLGLRRYFANFIQKDRPPLRLFQQTALGADRAGEGTLDMAEKFAFQQGFGEGAAVDGQEGFVLQRAFHVDVPGQHRFARAGFPHDNHRGGGIGDFLDPTQQIDDAFALADDHRGKLVLGVFLEAHVRQFAVQGAEFQCALGQNFDLGQFERFGKVVERPLLYGFDGALDRPHAGNDDKGQGVVRGAGLLQQIEPADIPQVEIRNDQIVNGFVNGPPGLFPAGDAIDFVPLADQKPA